MLFRESVSSGRLIFVQKFYKIIASVVVTGDIFSSMSLLPAINHRRCVDTSDKLKAGVIASIKIRDNL